MEGSESSAKDDGGGLKGKSCKGCLYYSSIRKSKSRNPLCLGITGALQQGISLILNTNNLYFSSRSNIYVLIVANCFSFKSRNFDL